MIFLTMKGVMFTVSDWDDAVFVTENAMQANMFFAINIPTLQKIYYNNNK